MRHLWIRYIELSLLPSAEQIIEFENQKLANILVQASNETDRQTAFFGLLLLRRALDSLEPRARFALLRSADWRTYAITRIKSLFKVVLKNDEVYFFYETFGYRFVILLPLKLESGADYRKGFIVHICRVCKSEDNDPERCLDETANIL